MNNHADYFRRSEFIYIFWLTFLAFDNSFYVACMKIKKIKMSENILLNQIFFIILYLHVIQKMSYMKKKIFQLISDFSPKKLRCL